MPRLTHQHGMTLIELLIAMVVLAIGVTALVAGLGGGILAVQRGARTTIAATFADKQMEIYRRQAFVSLPVQAGPQTLSPAPPYAGSDGKSYWLDARISWTCPVPPASSAQTSTGSAPSCCAAPASCTVPVRPVKLVTLTVTDGTASGKVLYTETSTFDASTG